MLLAGEYQFKLQCPAGKQSLIPTYTTLLLLLPPLYLCISMHSY